VAQGQRAGHTLVCRPEEGAVAVAEPGVGEPRDKATGVAAEAPEAEAPEGNRQQELVVPRESTTDPNNLFAINQD